MIRRPPRSTLDRSSAASDVYKRQALNCALDLAREGVLSKFDVELIGASKKAIDKAEDLSLIHISEPTRPY